MIMGKTALAATVVADWIVQGRGAVLWQKVWSELGEVIFEYFSFWGGFLLGRILV